MIKCILSAATLLATAAAGQAATIQNGSFELSNVAFLNNRYATVSAGDATALPGWTIGAGDLDLISGFWSASDGDYSLDLNGRSPATIWQDVAGLDVGATYLVSFDFAANWLMRDSQQLKRLRASAGGTSADYEFLTDGETAENMGWLEKSFSFTARESSERLTFSSLVSGYGGPALDNVQIRMTEAAPAPAPVPLPPAVALLAGAIGGLGMLGRRSRIKS